MKDRTRNREVLYGEEFADLVLDGKTSGTAHRTGGEQAPPKRPDVSQNYWCPLYGARLLARWLPAKTRAAFLRAYAAACVQDPTPQLRSPGWMGSEPGSLVYLALHFLPWFAAWFVGRMEEAREWCRFTLAMLEVCSTPEGRCLLVGQRSAKPGMDKPGWHDALLAASRGLDPRDSPGWPRGKKGGLVPLEDLPWIWHVLMHWRKEIAELGLDIPFGIAAFEVLRSSPLRMRTEYCWAHRSDGTLVAVWIDSRSKRADINGNTPPMLAMVRNDDGSVTSLPRNGGGQDLDGDGIGDVKIRQDSDNAACTLRGDSLVYRADHSRPSPDSIQLPPGLVYRSSLTGY